MCAASVRVGVIGTGRAGMIHARNLAGSVAGARLVALVDSDERSVRQAATELGVTRTYSDVRDALADDAIDAIVVVTPTNTHRDIVVSAARAGKHVLCEKPMAMNADECAEMIVECDRAGVTLQIGFMRRFDASYRECSERLRSGEIGEVNQIKSLTHGPSVPQEWMLDVGRSNGPLAEVSSHDIDTVRWLAGSEITEVYAIADNFRCLESASRYPDFYDTVVLVCRLENGVQGIIHGAVSVGYGYDARTEVLGTDGLIRVGELAADRVVRHVRGGSTNGQTVQSWRQLFKNAYLEEDAAFVRTVCNGEAPEVSGHDGLQAVRVVNAGNESVRTGKPIAIPKEMT